MPNDQIRNVGQVVAQDRNMPVGNSRPVHPAPVESVSSSPEAVKEAFVSTPPDPELLKQATEQINEFIRSNSHNLQFSVDKALNRIIVKVVDQETGEVIRQIPAEETLAIAQSLGQSQGLVIRSKA